MAVTSACKDGGMKMQMDNGKYVRYTPEQVEALERLYHECPKPSSMRRQQLIRECPILSNIEPKQIKVWFQNRRYCHLFSNFHFSVHQVFKFLSWVAFPGLFCWWVRSSLRLFCIICFEFSLLAVFLQMQRETEERGV